MYWMPQANTNNVNKTWAFIQTTESKDEPNWHHNTELIERKDT